MALPHSPKDHRNIQTLPRRQRGDTVGRDDTPWLGEAGCKSIVPVITFKDLQMKPKLQLNVLSSHAKKWTITFIGYVFELVTFVIEPIISTYDGWPRVILL